MLKLHHTSNTFTQLACICILAGLSLIMYLSVCMQIIITQNPEAEPSDEVLPVSYPKFTSMIQKGDMIFVGRYLVTGSEDSSLYVKVSSHLMLC